ncbi:MAG TPA: DUF4129 domain-containing protein [Streptosporangiaceae bacterium]|nr:DUF4129 domain-containing protein [Streptosporangiaceae bacterium]
MPRRVLDAVGRWLGHLFNAGSALPGGWWALVAFAALAVLLIALVTARYGPVARAHRRKGAPPRAATPVNAREHRKRAAQLAAAGNYSGAIIESTRAITAALEEGDVIPAKAGRTADEIADEAARALPSDATGLRLAARLFDDICYGERAGTAAGYELVRALGERIIAQTTAARGTAARHTAQRGSGTHGSGGPRGGTAGPLAKVGTGAGGSQ